mmetsp:Transcript_26581/g.82167  ORF Transcript_26581/g.82167 Transcript_26581/m.82167 type:complete len:270 (-) Transcript_26581:268-1077(-)
MDARRDERERGCPVVAFACSAGCVLPDVTCRRGTAFSSPGTCPGRLSCSSLVSDCSPFIGDPGSNATVPEPTAATELVCLPMPSGDFGSLLLPASEALRRAGVVATDVGRGSLPSAGISSKASPGFASPTSLTHSWMRRRSRRASTGIESLISSAYWSTSSFAPLNFALRTWYAAFIFATKSPGSVAFTAALSFRASGECAPASSSSRSGSSRLVFSLLSCGLAPSLPRYLSSFSRRRSALSSLEPPQPIEIHYGRSPNELGVVRREGR